MADATSLGIISQFPVQPEKEGDEMELILIILVLFMLFGGGGGYWYVGGASRCPDSGWFHPVEPFPEVTSGPNAASTATGPVSLFS